MERRVVDAVAVAARSAPRALIQSMIERALPEQTVDALVRGGLLAEARTGTLSGERELAFRQHGVGSIVAQTVSPEARRRFHALAARWLLTRAGRAVPGRQTLLAEHFIGSGGRAEAAQGLLDAARGSARAFAVREAFELYGFACEIARDLATGESDTPELRELLAEAALGRARWGHRIGEHKDALA